MDIINSIVHIFSDTIFMSVFGWFARPLYENISNSLGKGVANFTLIVIEAAFYVIVIAIIVTIISTILKKKKAQKEAAAGEGSVKKK